MGSSVSRVAHAEQSCPVDHTNMTEHQIAHIIQRYDDKADAALPAPTQHHAPQAAGKPPHLATEADTSHAQTLHTASSCPVDHANMSKEQIDAYMSKQHAQPQHGPASGREPSSRNSATVYDVYGQELDRANLMPATPNQLPSPGQTARLSTDRVKSAIPKSGEHDTWTYPSPQMFFNALKRKGKADGVQEADVPTVVAVHNAMNERTWAHVMEWERKYHCHQCQNPKLKSFMGRPNDLSPAARFRTWFRGYPMPFDRHDWIIDRCGLQDARYIIDYYYREGSDPIEIHVRPALDSVPAAYDRMRERLDTVQKSLSARLHLTADSVNTDDISHPPSVPSHDFSSLVKGDSLDQAEFDFLSSLTASDVEEISKDVRTRCTKVGEAFKDAGNDPVKLEQANVAVNYCMAQRICKSQAIEFMDALETATDEREAYGKMTSCLDRFHIVARRAMLEAAGVVQSGPEFPAGVKPSVSPS